MVPLLVDEASPPFEHHVQVGQHVAEQQLEPRTMRQNLGSGHGRKGLGCRMRVGGDCGGLLRWAASPAPLGGESRVGLVGSRQPGSSEETGNFKMSKNIISSRLAAPRFSRNRLLKPSFCQMIRFCSHIGPNPSGWKVCFSGGEKFTPLVASSPKGHSCWSATDLRLRQARIRYRL